MSELYVYKLYVNEAVKNEKKMSYDIRPSVLRSFRKCFHLFQFKERQLNDIIIFIQHVLRVTPLQILNKEWKYGWGFRECVPE